MVQHGYDDGEIAHVAKLIRKEQLKERRESQALENVVAVVFLEHYFAEFDASHSGYDDAKMIDIIGGGGSARCRRKGLPPAMALPLSERTRKLIEAALAREAETLKKLAQVAID